MMHPMETAKALIGKERSLREVAQALHFSARGLSAPAVGALHLTCSDESEHECIEALQQGFVQYLLPSLKFARQSAFRLANLGGRYEWSAVRLAEDHFALPATTGAFKLLVVKINAHVAFEEQPGKKFRLGRWQRYGVESTCCGALAQLLSGGPRLPHTDDLAETFHSEGRDRIAALKDPTRVDPLYAPLYAALVSSRLQARKAVLDIQDYKPKTPTYYVVLPAVTINRAERDTEIVCGMYTIDGRAGGTDAVYTGLGDLPEAYEISIEHNRFTVTDDQLGQERKGRDHRAMARERAATSKLKVHDQRLDRVRTDVARNKHKHHSHARQLLRIALPVLAEVAPIPAAILAFGDGAVGIHHAFKIHRIAGEMKDTEEARRILDDIEAQVDQLSPDRAEALLELLVSDFK
jgi:hypothetical protein